MDVFDILLDIRFISLILGIFIPLMLYKCSIQNHNYWKERGIPYVKPYPFIGSASFTKNLEDTEIERYNKYGRIYGIFEGSKPILCLAKPELLKNILIKDFQYFTTRRVFEIGDPILDKLLTVLQGEDWKRIRSIVSPTFSTGKIKRVMGIFDESARTLIKNFKTSSDTESFTDVLKFYGAFTMDVIASSAFSTKLDSHNNPDNEFVKNAKAAFTLTNNIKLILMVVLPKLLKMLGLGGLNQDNFDFFKKLTLEIIQKRKETGQTKNDFLQLLMDTAKEVSPEEILTDKSEHILDNYGNDDHDQQFFKNISNKHMSMDELVAQCVIFFIAGYHTTATTLSLATYHLALNEDEQEKVFNEMKCLLEETDGKVTYELVQKLKYLDNVISETLRIHAPIVWLERTSDIDYKLGESGITVPKGMIVHIPIFAMHRDPKNFPDPEKFDPERFSPEEKDKQIPYSFLPFGAGPRNCIGMRFALVELKVCLVYVLCTFKAKKCSNTKIPLEFGKGAGLIQPKSIELSMQPRTNNPLKL